MNRLPVSVCLILKNEEEFLSQSLSSIIGLASELVLLDHGSTDRTEEIAFQFKSQVPLFIWNKRAWTDDFSEARNAAASMATQPWILFVDGDEVLEAKAAEAIAESIRSDTLSCYSFIQRNYTSSPGLELAQRANELPPGLPPSPLSLFFLENWMERLYKNNLGLKYEGQIHESLIPSCERLGLRHGRLPVVLHHYGRLKKQNPEKLLYYLKLTEKKMMAEEDNPVAWIELATNLMELSRFEQAFQLTKEAVKKFPEQPEVLRIGFQAALRADQFQIAESWIHRFLQFQPKDLYAKSQLTTAFLYQGKFDCVFSTADEIFCGAPNDFVAHLNCGVIYFEKEDWPNAARHLEAALHQRPEDSFVRDALKKVTANLQKH